MIVEGRVGTIGGDNRVARGHQKPDKIAQKSVNPFSDKNIFHPCLHVIGQCGAQIVAGRIAVFPDLERLGLHGLEGCGRGAEEAFIGAKPRPKRRATAALKLFRADERHGRRQGLHEVGIAGSGHVGQLNPLRGNVQVLRPKAEKRPSVSRRYHVGTAAQHRARPEPQPSSANRPSAARSLPSSSSRRARVSRASSTTSSGALATNLGLFSRPRKPPSSFSSLPRVFSSRAFSSATSMISATGIPKLPPSTATVMQPLGSASTWVNSPIRARRVIIA